MGNNSTINDKLERLKALAEELSTHIENSMVGEAAGLMARARFDCGDYTCHGHFTCSSFGCSDNFKIADR